jgi:histone-lysine N-methyltransferase SETD2
MDTLFTAFEEVEYVYLHEPIFSKQIEEKLRNELSASTICAENKEMHLECPTNCDSGSNCDNKQLTFLRNLGKPTRDRLAGRLEQKPTNSQIGDGLFALRNYAIKEAISEYCGKAFLLNKDEVLPDSNYIMHLKGNCYLDSKEYGNLSRFVNHSCDPNATVEKIDDVSLCVWVVHICIK